MPRRARAALAILAALLLPALSISAAGAQSAPSRPVAVGSIGDTVGRAIARPRMLGYRTKWSAAIRAIAITVDQ